MQHSYLNHKNHVWIRKFNWLIYISVGTYLIQLEYTGLFNFSVFNSTRLLSKMNKIEDISSSFFHLLYNIFNRNWPLPPAISSSCFFSKFRFTFLYLYHKPLYSTIRIKSNLSPGFFFSWNINTFWYRSLWPMVIFFIKLAYKPLLWLLFFPIAMERKKNF